MNIKTERHRRNKKLRAYYGDNIDLQNMSQEEKDNLFTAIPVMNSVSSFTLNEPVCYANCVVQQQPVEENTMNTTVNTFESERRALRDLLCKMESAKKEDIIKANHINPYRPKTKAEIVQLLKDGKVTLHPDYAYEEDLDAEIGEWHDPRQFLAFNYQKPNKSAYREGCVKLEKESAKLRTQIAVLPPEEALKKLEAFESKTFH